MDYITTWGKGLCSPANPLPCTRYQPVQHPVWGDIVGVVTIKALSQGQELFCDYGYDPDTQVRGAVDIDLLS